MQETRPFKDKPWLVLHKANWLESLLGVSDRLETDTSHPEWIEQVLKPTIERWKRIEHLMKSIKHD